MASNNYYSNTQNPANNAINNVQGNNPYAPLKPKSKTGFFDFAANPFGASPKSPTPPPSSPASYAGQLESAYTGLGELQKKRGILSQAPLGQMNVGSRADDVKSYQAGLLAAESKPYEQQIAASSKLLDTSLPQAIAQGSSVINPLTGQQLAGFSPKEASFNAGIYQNATSQGQNYAANQVNQQKLDQAGQFLNGIISGTGYQSLGLVPANVWKNQILKNLSNEQINSLQTSLNAIAQLLPEGNQKNELLKASTGDLANSNPAAIQAALTAASGFLGSQNNAIIQQYGGVQNGSQTGGQSSGGFINTAVGPVPNNY